MSDKFLDEIEKKYLRDEQVEPWESGELGRDSEHARVSDRPMKGSVVSTLQETVNWLAIITGVEKPLEKITIHPKVFDKFVTELIFCDELVFAEAIPTEGPISWEGVMIYKGGDDAT